MDFLGTAPLPAMVELSLNPAWMGASAHEDWRKPPSAGNRCQVWPGSRIRNGSRAVGPRIFGLDTDRCGGLVAHRLGRGPDFQCGAPECLWTPAFDPEHGLVGAPRSTSGARSWLRPWGMAWWVRCWRMRRWWACWADSPFLGVLRGWTAAHLLPILEPNLHWVWRYRHGAAGPWDVISVRASTDSCEPRRRNPLFSQIWTAPRLPPKAATRFTSNGRTTSLPHWTRLLAAGYLLMSGGGVEDPNEFSDEIFSTRRITIAPLTVLLGYSVIFYSILKRFPAAEDAA